MSILDINYHQDQLIYMLDIQIWVYHLLCKTHNISFQIIWVSMPVMMEYNQDGLV
jgi:hypothetical protein